MHKNIIWRHILYFIIICLFIFLAAQFDLGCPIWHILQIPCPTCGVTRALTALLRLDIKGYLYFHPLALPLLASVWLMIHRRLFKKERVIFTSVIAVLLANLVLYAVRLTLFLLQQ